IDIVYGARSKEDLLQYREIIDEWCKDEGVNVYLTIDREQPEWDGHVGFVPNYVKELGFDKTQVYTTLELRMKCGVGKCGRCNVGAKYVCKDGPVFRCDELDELPDEY
ncbi:MAG: hydrogenase, partial [Clostridia bacterium]|nr:hydrogenase [Clostridia bacterium]